MTHVIRRFHHLSLYKKYYYIPHYRNSLQIFFKSSDVTAKTDAANVSQKKPKTIVKKAATRTKNVDQTTNDAAQKKLIGNAKLTATKDEVKKATSKPTAKKKTTEVKSDQSDISTNEKSKIKKKVIVKESLEIGDNKKSKTAKKNVAADSTKASVSKPQKVENKDNNTVKATRTRKSTSYVTDDQEVLKILRSSKSTSLTKLDLVKPLSTCDLIEGDLDNKDKETFQCFVEEFSLPYLPYVTSILKQTRSDESKYFTDRWKRRMIEEMGLYDFLRMQENDFRMGDIFHACVLEFLSGKAVSEIPLEPDIEGYWHSVEKVFKNVGDVFAMEKTVYHHSLLYNGKFDCLAQFQGEPCLIDWKTSKKPKPFISNTYDNPIQLAAYLGAYNSVPIVPEVGKVSKAAIVIAYREGHPAHVHIMNLNTCKKYWSKWLERLKLYWTQQYESLKKKQDKIQSDMNT